MSGRVRVFGSKACVNGVKFGHFTENVGDDNTEAFINTVTPLCKCESIGRDELNNRLVLNGVVTVGSLFSLKVLDFSAKLFLERKTDIL